MTDDFIVGKQRRKIEDAIVRRYKQVNFKQDRHGYLEDKSFWDFVFSWYDLARYYELSEDTAIGAHMLELFAHCGQIFRQAATDADLRERRRDKAADALYQLTYHVNQMMIYVERNARTRESQTGTINWRDDDPNTAHLN